jgi:hypothetical protein
MGKGYSSIGLRIIFGCAKSMNIVPSLSEVYDWEMFCLQWNEEEANDLSAETAIRLLRFFFGKKRPVLLLIDELSQAKFGYDKIVITEVGNLLDNYGNLDVIISSLPPNHITDLVTSNSQRNINYSILRPLIDFDDMRIECNNWIDAIIPISLKVNDFVLNLIRSTYLLVSGDPRSLEYFAMK